MHLVIFFPMQLSSTAFLAASTSGSSGIVLSESLWLLSMEFSRVAFLFSCYSHDILCVFFVVVPLHVSMASNRTRWYCCRCVPNNGSDSSHFKLDYGPRDYFYHPIGFSHTEFLVHPPNFYLYS
jgi:hypothetical protein